MRYEICDYEARKVYLSEELVCFARVFNNTNASDSFILSVIKADKVGEAKGVEYIETEVKDDLYAIEIRLLNDDRTIETTKNREELAKIINTHITLDSLPAKDKQLVSDSIEKLVSENQMFDISYGKKDIFKRNNK